MSRRWDDGGHWWLAAAQRRSSGGPLLYVIMEKDKRPSNSSGVVCVCVGWTEVYSLARCHYSICHQCRLIMAYDGHYHRALLRLLGMHSNPTPSLLLSSWKSDSVVRSSFPDSRSWKSIAKPADCTIPFIYWRPTSVKMLQSRH